MIVVDFLFKVYEFIALSYGFVIAILVAIGFVIIPFWYLYHLFKIRKNKKEFLNVLFSGVALIFFVTIYFFINKA
jgi:pilus assembly protein TadC